MTVSEMKLRKQELEYSNEQVSALSGVPLGTVIQVFSGATRSPRHATLAALEKVLAPGCNVPEKQPGADPESRSASAKSPRRAVVREPDRPIRIRTSRNSG